MSGKLILRHAAIVRVDDGRCITDCDVIIEEGRISRIAGASQNSVEAGSIVDCQGKFLIPGLWDMHAHISLYGEHCLAEMLRYGVIGVRDMGGISSDIDVWRRQIADGSRLGPEIFRCGPFIDGPKKMRPDREQATSVVETQEEAIVATQNAIAEGADFIKVHSRLGKEAFSGVLAAAARGSLKVAVHLPVALSVEEILQPDVISLEHAESLLENTIYIEDEPKRESAVNAKFDELFSERGEDLLQRFAHSGVWLTPTLIALRVVFDNEGTAFEKSLPTWMVALTGRAHSSGIRLLAGTDFAWPDAGIRAGEHLHEELKLLVDAGLSTLEALRCATINAAECLGVAEQYGTVEVGKAADLVLLDGDPIADISNTSCVSGVVRKGQYFTREEVVGLTAGL